jgi:pimeloyl-ACP methyl ester carboxylesterase
VDKQDGYIKTFDAKIYYEFLNKKLLSEEKPLLVFLHEGLGSIEQWRDFPALLCKKVNCPGFLYDREGYGKSEKLRDKRDSGYLEHEAKIVLPEVLKKLSLQQTKKILIGHSDGASISLIYAGSFQENIIGVISEAAHLFIEDVSVEGIREAVVQFEKGKLKDLLKKYHREKTDNMFYGWAHTWLNPEFKKWNIEKYLPGISAPVLAIQGEDDQYGSFAQLKSIKKSTKNAEIKFIPNCGHTPHLQMKEEIILLLGNFINKII